MKANIYLPDDMALVLRARNPENMSNAIQTAIERYNYLLALSKQTLDEKFSDGEKGFIVDVLNGTLFVDTVSIRYAGSEVAEALGDPALLKKWKIKDANSFRNLLTALPEAQSLALVEAVEAFWRAVGRGEQPSHKDLFR